MAANATPNQQTPRTTPDGSAVSDEPPHASQGKKTPIGRRLRQHFKAEVSTRHTDILMLICCVISGLQDSAIYSAYGTFVSMQTGNTIFVGLGTSTAHQSPKPYGWVKSLTSIIFFLLGSLFFSRFLRFFSPLRRSTLAASFTIQSLFIIITAAIIQSRLIDAPSPSQPGYAALTASGINWKEEAPIVILSFQAAGQMTASRVLGLNEIPTVVLTSVICDFASDPLLFAGFSGSAKRNRRFLAFFGILGGAIAGGWMTRATNSIAEALWLSAGLKLIVVLAWTLWRGDSHGLMT